MSDQSEIEERVLGRTIIRVERTEGCVTLFFDDGTKISFFARGSEEQWLSVD